MSTTKVTKAQLAALTDAWLMHVGMLVAIDTDKAHCVREALEVTPEWDKAESYDDNVDTLQDSIWLLQLLRERRAYAKAEIGAAAYAMPSAERSAAWLRVQWSTLAERNGVMPIVGGVA